MSPELERWLPLITLIGVVLVTLFATAVIPTYPIEASLDEPLDTILLCVLAVVALAQSYSLFTYRNLARSPESAARRPQLVLSAYAMAFAPAIFGLVAVVFTDNPLVALPFGFLGLIYTAMAWQFFSRERPA
jgi:hypothetical protein